eukprot:15238517-Alexandrium_andersonii.AAC.1
MSALRLVGVNTGRYVFQPVVLGGQGGARNRAYRLRRGRIAGSLPLIASDPPDRLNRPNWLSCDPVLPEEDQWR